MGWHSINIPGPFRAVFYIVCDIHGVRSVPRLPAGSPLSVVKVG